MRSVYNSFKSMGQTLPTGLDSGSGRANRCSAYSNPGFHWVCSTAGQEMDHMHSHWRRGGYLCHRLCSHLRFALIKHPGCVQDMHPLSCTSVGLQSQDIGPCTRFQTERPCVHHDLALGLTFISKESPTGAVAIYRQTFNPTSIEESNDTLAALWRTRRDSRFRIVD